MFSRLNRSGSFRKISNEKKERKTSAPELSYDKDTPPHSHPKFPMVDISTIAEGEVLFSYYESKKIKMKGDTVPTINEGELVEVLNKKTSKNRFFARSDQQSFEFHPIFLELDLHSPNCYLWCVDELVKNPTLLLKILNRPNKRFANEGQNLKDLVDIATARRLLPKLLMAQLQLEFKTKLTGNICFREDNGSELKLIKTILSHSSSIKQFNEHFINFLCKALETTPELKSADHSPDMKLISVLKLSFKYFSNLRAEDFPPELIMICRAVKAATMEFKIENKELSKILGALFFLRCICPSIIQSERLKKVFDTTHPFDRVALSKAFQYISNQTTPEHNEGSNAIFTPDVLGEMALCHEMTEALFDRITQMPFRLVPTPVDLVKPAASFYGLMMDTYWSDPEEKAQYSLDELNKRLGDAPVKTLTATDIAYKQSFINMVSAFIEGIKSSLHQSGSPQLGLGK